MCKEINMTKREISRADIFSEITQNKISQTKAAEVLGISIRHVQRLYAQYRAKGIVSLVSKQLGKPSNHQLPRILKARINELITCETYAGFGPTLMCEKLNELHGIEICPETMRQMMIQAEIWEASKKRHPVIHQQRKRRTRFGELVQIDGSPHAWFEDRGDPCVLIVFIDDATGCTYGKFFESETTQAYMITTWEYIIKYGRPLAFYSDKHGIFRINKPGCLKKELITQYGRACKELDIEIICANTPQAKGRVERNNKTQQDRLVKELRLRGISTIDEANKFLATYWWETFNGKFAVHPENKEDAHRKLLQEHNIEKILCYKDTRTISKNLEVQHDNIIYQIIVEKPSWNLRGAKVTVVRNLKGQIYIEYKNKELPFRIFSQQEFKGEEINSKEIDRFLNESKTRKVLYRHPWKKEGRAEANIKSYKNI
jgi:transposase